MSVDYSKVNISLNEFQRLSEGKYNAGEVRLAGETTLKKMNYHVHTTSKNNKTISHEEVLTIKEALVNALSNHGVEEDEINRIRRELGLAPDGDTDRTMDTRSMKPLTRQQIREILDRNAQTINKSSTVNGDRVFISTTNMLYGPTGMDANRAEKRNRVAAQLNAADRRYANNPQAVAFNAVVSDLVDYESYEMRKTFADEARAQLNALLETCNGHPREDVPATATLHLPSGQTITVPTGKSEAAFARQLEDAIVRLTDDYMKDEECNGLLEYNAKKTPDAKAAFVESLKNDPKGGLKARAIAIGLLYHYGLNDYARLSVPNRLSDEDAIALARYLALLPKDNLNGDVLAHDATLLAMAAKPPKIVKPEGQAYVPVTAPNRFNQYVSFSLIHHPERGLPAFNSLFDETMAVVRNRLGKKGLPDGTRREFMVDGKLFSALFDEKNGAERVTPESLREPLLQAALKTGAIQIVTTLVDEELDAAGKKQYGISRIVNSISAHHPELIERLAAATSPDEIERIADDARNAVRDAIHIYTEITEARAGVENRAIEAIAKKFGLPPEAIAGLISTNLLSLKANKLRDKIADCEKGLSTKAEYVKAFNDLTDAFVTERIASLDAVDAFDDLPPKTKDALVLPPETKKAIKIQLLTIEKVKGINLAFLAEQAKRIDAAALEEALQSNAPMEQVFTAMKPINDTIHSVVDKMLEGKEEIGPDDTLGPMAILVRMIVANHPGLDRLLEAFYARKDVKEKLDERDEFVKSSLHASKAFEIFASDPKIYTSAEKEAILHERLFVSPGRIEAFNAAGGAERAAAAGYHPSEFYRLAQAFGLYKAATSCSDAEALDAVLDPQSKARRLLDYGGRFTANAENFAKGIRLMERYETWFSKTVDNAKAKNFTTTTERYICEQACKDKKTIRGVERFLFEEIAHNKTLSLDAENPEDVFGMERNRAMRFIGRGYTSGCSNSLAQIPPEQRSLIYDVMDVMDPLPANGAKVNARNTIQQAPILVARIMKNYEDVADLKGFFQLDRKHLIPLLYGDLDIKPDATNVQINDAFDNRLLTDPVTKANPTLVGPVQLALTTSGTTVNEAISAVQEGRSLPNAPGIASANGELWELDGTATGGRNAMVMDLTRVTMPQNIATDAPAMSVANLKFTVRFPDGKTLDSITDKTGKADRESAVNDIADKIETLCGKMHPKQLSAVYFLLSQSGLSNVKNGFTAQGIATDEHMPMTFTLTKDEATGAVTVTYTEPEGFPLRFHWTATVALDGTVTSTPMVIE